MWDDARYLSVKAISLARPSQPPSRGHRDVRARALSFVLLLTTTLSCPLSSPAPARSGPAPHSPRRNSVDCRADRRHVGRPGDRHPGRGGPARPRAVARPPAGRTEADPRHAGAPPADAGRLARALVGPGALRPRPFGTHKGRSPAGVRGLACRPAAR